MDAAAVELEDLDAARRGGGGTSSVGSHMCAHRLEMWVVGRLRCRRKLRTDKPCYRLQRLLYMHALLRGEDALVAGLQKGGTGFFLLLFGECAHGITLIDEHIGMPVRISWRYGAVTPASDGPLIDYRIICYIGEAFR